MHKTQTHNFIIIFLWFIFQTTIPAVISYEFHNIVCVLLQNSVQSVLSFQSRQCFANIPAHITLFSSFQTRVLFQRYKIIVLFFSIGSVYPVFPFYTYSYSSLCRSDSGLTAVSIMISLIQSSFEIFLIPPHYKFSYFISSSMKFFAKPYIYNPTYCNRLLDNPQDYKHTCF